MIQGSVYLVTGGASGLGKSTAELLLLEGAYVTILDLQPIDEDTSETYGDRILGLQVDITSEKDVLNAIDATKRKFGKLNGVINCAGICQKCPIYDFKSNEPHSLQEFAKLINVNLIGTFNVVRLAIPVLAENEPNSEGETGIIINTSSTAGHQSLPGYSAYSASKAGIIALSSSLARELSDHKIRVLDIAPGMMDTPMAKRPESATNETLKHLFTFPKRKGKPSEFAHLVKSIIENKLLNGASIRLDGALRL